MAPEDERRIRHLHKAAREVTGSGAVFRMLRNAGFAPSNIDGRLAIVLPLVPIRGPGMPGYFETPFFEDSEALS